MIMTVIVKQSACRWWRELIHVVIYFQWWIIFCRKVWRDPGGCMDPEIRTED